MARIIFTEELIATFIEKIKGEYPHLSDRTIDKVCRAEFQMMKDVVKSGALEDIRLQYLFKVTVSPQRIMKQLSYMYRKRDKISDEAHAHYLTMILNHVKDNKSKFKKYEHTIETYTGYTREQIDRGEYNG